MSVLAAETGDALGCCVFWAALRGRYPTLAGFASQLTSALGLYGYTGRKPREHWRRHFLVCSEVILGGLMQWGEPSPPPLKQQHQNGMLNRKLSSLSCHVSSELVNG